MPSVKLFIIIIIIIIIIIGTPVGPTVCSLGSFQVPLPIVGN
jgi:hypothetical protein